MRHLRAPRRLVVALAALLVAATSPVPTVAVEPQANTTIYALSLSGSPFAEDFPPLPQSVQAQLVLTQAARVTVRVAKPGGTRIRTLAYRVPLGAGTHNWSWDGRDDLGNFVPDGLYELRAWAVNAMGHVLAIQGLRKGLPPIYPANPGAIVIAVDPGHGGRYSGAVYNHVYEKNVNLQISLDLQALLQHAGVQVVMTRTTDVAVDDPASDVNGDGLINGFDDLEARNDIANLARADINIHNHLNAYGCRCTRGTQTYTNFEQPWTPQAADLATRLQSQQVNGLQQFSDGTYYPIDRGVTDGHYYYMTPYSVVCPQAIWHGTCRPPYQPRPSLVPSVLTESLFLNNDIEFALVMRPDVRLALAASMYTAIADYLNHRSIGIRYDPVTTPTAPVSAGSQQTYTIRVTNRGNAASSGWTLVLGAVPAVPLYDGSGQVGTPLGSVAVPDGVEPGQSVDLTVDATAPSGAGDWLVKGDIKLADTTYASTQGVAPIQLKLTTTSP